MHGARLRPLLAWELLGGSGGLAEPLAAPRAPALASTLSSTRRSRLRTPRTVLSRPAGALALVLTAAALAAAAACICRFGAGPRSLYCPRSPAQCSRVGSTHHRAHRGHRWALLLVLALAVAAPWHLQSPLMQLQMNQPHILRCLLWQIANPKVTFHAMVFTHA